ncbi:MAG: hypothetical protein ACK5L5_01745 [Bacteroidales bacterium]
MSDKELKNYLQERLGDYEHQPQTDLWAAIEQEAKRKKQKPALLLFAYALGAAAVLVFALLLFPKQQQQQQQQQLPASPVVESESKEAINASAPAESNAKLQLAEVQAKENSTQTKDETKANGNNHADGTIVDLCDLTITDSYIVECEEKKNNEEKEKKEKQQAKDDEIKIDYGSLKQSQMKTQWEKHKASKITLVMGNTSSGALRADPSSKGKANTPPPIFALRNSPVEIPNTVDKDKDYGELDYDFPINLEFAVRKQLSDRLALESGLSYTFLRASNDNIVLKQTYLGIPLRGIYTINVEENISLYMGLGGMLEYQVKGTFEDKDGSGRLRNNHPQWSARSSIGADVKISKMFGVFIEPGLSYYFNDKSKIPNIRHKAPFRFNFKIGIRYYLD